MPNYITGIQFTQKGIQEIGNTTKRAAAFKTSSKKLGIKVKEIFWTLGEYDGFLIFEAADDETATAAMLQLEALGNVHTTTSRAFTSAEMDTILAKMQQ